VVIHSLSADGPPRELHLRSAELTCRHSLKYWFTVEVCTGMGVPIPVGFPWDSHGNGSSFGLLMGMEMGMGIVLMGIGIAYFIGDKMKFPSIFIDLSSHKMWHI